MFVAERNEQNICILDNFLAFFSLSPFLPPFLYSFHISKPWAAKKGVVPFFKIYEGSVQISCRRRAAICVGDRQTTHN